MSRVAVVPTPTSLATRHGYGSIARFGGFGLLLGVAARAWMRLISTDYEFSWVGSGFIVAGFTVFGVGQSVAALAVARDWRRPARWAARTAGAVTTLPLFFAAGAVMAPAVVLGGLAVWRSRWHPIPRLVLAFGAVVDAVLVSMTITSDLGTSWRSALGVGGLVAVYACVLWMVGGTATPARTAD
ncbi:MAG TPA: hypothetical protein VIS05_10275 [Ilumatobacter sp.]